MKKEMSQQSAICMSSIIKFGKCTHKGNEQQQQQQQQKSMSDCEKYPECMLIHL